MTTKKTEKTAKPAAKKDTWADVNPLEELKRQVTDLKHLHSDASIQNILDTVLEMIAAQAERAG